MLKKMKKCGLIAGIMGALVIMTGCGGKAPAEAAAESVTESVETVAEKEAVITGEAAWVFRTADGMYYWKYSPESFEETAVFANYKAVPGVKNQFVFRGADGTENVLFEAEGYGAVVIVGDRLFYESPMNEYGSTVIRSCTLDGQDVVEYGEGELLFGTDDGRGIICKVMSKMRIDRIEVIENIRKVLVENAIYLDRKGDIIYYQPQEADSEAAIFGQVTLAQVKTDGSNPKNLYTTAPDLYEGDFQGAAEIARLIVREDKIYFSYGSVSGSAMFFQGGKVIKMDSDGNNAEVAAGNEGLVNSIFSVNEDGSVSSEFSQFDEILFTPGEKTFSMDGTMYVFDKSTGAPEVILTPEDYASVGSGLCNYYDTFCLQIDPLEVSGGCAYYLASYGTEDPSGNIGWRTAYRRENGALLEKNLETGAVTTLFSY